MVDDDPPKFLTQDEADAMQMAVLKSMFPWATRYNVRYFLAAAVAATALGVALHFLL